MNDDQIQESPQPNQSLQTSAVGKWLAIAASILLLAFPVGLILSIVSIVETYLEITRYGTGDPRLMADGIATALVSTIIGLMAALPGAMLMCVSIALFRHRRPWVFRVSLTGALITLILFPYGTMVSIMLLYLLFNNRSSFYPKKVAVDAT